MLYLSNDVEERSGWPDLLNRFHHASVHHFSSPPLHFDKSILKFLKEIKRHIVFKEVYILKNVSGKANREKKNYQKESNYPQRLPQGVWAGQQVQ